MRCTTMNRIAVTAAIIMGTLSQPAGADVGSAPAGADTVWLRNAAVAFGFDAGSGALLALLDAATGQHLVRGEGALWSLDLTGGSGRQLGPASAQRFAVRHPGFGQLRLEWSDFRLPEAPGLQVMANIRLRGDAPTAEWRLAWDSAGSLAVEQVHFPRIAPLLPMGPGEELVLPRWMGVLNRNPAAVLGGAGPYPSDAPASREGQSRRLVTEYPGMASIQLVALYRRDGVGFYAAANDTAAYRKSFVIWGETDGTRGYELIQPLENPATPKPRWSMRYAALIGTFQGDWITAAQRYRIWGTQQAWARNSRLQRGLVPEWLTQTGMWVWNRGRSPGVIPHAIALQEQLGLPVSVFWHWWHQGPYDTSFPDYLPPREGVPSFTAAVNAAHAAGVHAITYMNQRLWCTGQPSWGPEAAAAAVKERDGRVREEVYNIFDPKPCATMDVTQPYWRSKYAAIADTVLDQYGIDGIYMDQAVTSLVCWDSTHGHPVGGGNYWMGGFRQLAAQIRDSVGRGGDSAPERSRPEAARPDTLAPAAGRQLVLAGEGAGEPWLPELDLMLTLQVAQERYSDPSAGWEPIPLFQSVYHAYGVTYGSYSSLVMPPYDDLWPADKAPADSLALLDPKFRRQFYLEQARSFAWGLQPTIANFRVAQFSDRATETEYLMRLAKLRARALDYLLHGSFERPPAFEVPAVPIELSRVSIYAARDGRGPTVARGTYPAVVAGAWRSPAGNIALALASISEQPVTVAFRFDAGQYGLTGSGTIRRIDVDGASEIGNWSAAGAPVSIELPAAGATILEFRRADRRQ